MRKEGMYNDTIMHTNEPECFLMLEQLHRNKGEDISEWRIGEKKRLGPDPLKSNFLRNIVLRSF